MLWSLVYLVVRNLFALLWLLGLLGGRSLTLSELSPTDDDWYLNLLWIDRQKCILLTHADTLFSIFQAHVRRADLRPIGNYLVAAVESELRAENLPTDTFSQLQPDSVQLAKTASRSTLGFMNEMTFELRYFIADAGGLGRCNIDVLNQGLRRTLRNRGEYVRPIELACGVRKLGSACKSGGSTTRTEFMHPTGEPCLSNRSVHG